MEKFILKKNYKLTASILVLAIVFFVLNRWSPFAADDYSFMYSWADGERITSVQQIIETLVIVYNTLIGRILSVFFILFFLMFPKGLFDVVNTIVFVTTIYLVYKITDSKKKFSMIMFFFIPIAFWLFIPHYGQVFLWLNGSINYLWSYLFAIVFLLPYVKMYRDTELMRSKAERVGLCVYGLFFGSYVENVSFATAFACFLLVVAVMYEKREIKVYLSYVYPIIAAAIGFMAFLLSPGEMGTHVGGFELGTMGRMLVKILTTYYSYGKLLLILWAVLMVIAVHVKVNRKEIGLSLCYMFISVVSASVLCAGSYLAERSLGVSIFFLIVAVVNLMQALRIHIHLECAVFCICVYFFVANILTFWDGIYDIFDTNRRWQQRDAYIREQIVEGVEEVEAPFLQSATTYSSLYGLADVKEKGADDVWPSDVMGQYYGIRAVYRKAE